MGAPALTSRGFVEEDFEQVAAFFDSAVQISQAIKAEAIKVRMGHAARGDAHAEVARIGRRLYDEAQAREAREQQASVEMANRQSMGMAGGGFGGMMADAMAPTAT